MRITKQAEQYGNASDSSEQELPSEVDVEALLKGASIGRLGGDLSV